MRFYATVSATNDSHIETILNSPIWKVSKQGKVYRLVKNKWTKAASLDKYGYYTIKPRFNGKQVNLKVHRLVYAKYLGKLDANMVVHHKNANRADNNVKNLALITWQKNSSIKKRG